MVPMSELPKANVLGPTFAYDDTDPAGIRCCLQSWRLRWWHRSI